MSTSTSFVSTTDEIAGYRIIKTLGLVSSFERNFGFIIIDKEIEKLSNDMLSKATKLGGNGVIGVKMINSTDMVGSVGAVVIYGTAVLVEPLSL